jgi:hypothetical protein
VRRFAVESAGVPDAAYDNDLFTAAYVRGDDSFTNLVDYLLFATTLPAADDDELLLRYDELNIANSQADVLEMHRRWGMDVLAVARRYPTTAAMLA